MLRVDRGSRTPLPDAVQAELTRLVLSAAKESDAVLVSDYGAGAVGEGVRRALREIAARGVPVCADSRYDLRELLGLTVCKPNEPELQALTGVAIRDGKNLLEAAQRGLSLLDCQVLLVTRGRHGAALFTKGGDAHFIPVHGMKEAVDVTGAGDTVIAAFTLALAGGATPLQAAHVANVAGAVVVQKQGTGTVSREELLAELSSE
jgi:rfaE bifunctional protein kinase chain/domain